MSWYFYYFDGKGAWQPDLAESRQMVIQSKQPKYSTVLDIDTLISAETRREQVLQAHYRGPFYIDIDVSEEYGGPAKAILQTQELIAKFNSAGVDTRCLHLYASGSKGFHVEVPMSMFIQRVSTRGYQRLPMIYKLMAQEFFVQYMDMVVYTSGRGRQWRTPNVERENGRYKVPISLEELQGMTAEKYLELVSAPREAPEREAPVYSSALALAFAKAKDEAEAMLKKAQKSKLTDAQIAHWRRYEPEPLTKLLEGEGLSPDVGFQKIATQAAVAAVNLGWSAEQLVDRAAGLIANHVSDSRRYNTEAKRIRELERMYDYMSSNGSYYELALQPIKACLERVEEEEAEEGVEDEQEIDRDLSMGLRIDRTGIWKPDENLGEVRVCAMGLENVVALRRVEDGATIGYTADVYADGVLKGNKMLPIDTFTSRANLVRVAAAEAGSPAHMTDSQVGGTMHVLEHTARKHKKQHFVLNREGVDVIHHPHAPTEDMQLDVVYIGGDPNHPSLFSKLDLKYTIRSSGNDSVTPKSDLFNAPPLEANESSVRFFDDLFEINTPINLGRLTGWFVASFFSQIIRYKWKQFPILQVYGLAGSGKTRTCELLARMHYHRKPVDVKQASGMTAHAIKSRLAGSASIPILLDDMRFNTMDRRERHMMETFMLGSYNAANAENGTVRRETGVSHLDIREYKLGAPVVFMAETLNSESRILARSITVPMRKSDRGDEEAWSRVYLSDEGILGRLGWTIALAVASGDMNVIFKAVENNIDKVREAYGKDAYAEADRQGFNVAVLLTGLEMMVSTLRRCGFGDRYDARIQTMMDAVLEPSNESIVRDMDETSRVISTIAYLTKSEHPDTYRMQMGVDYSVDDSTVDLKLQNAYTKYALYMRSIGVRPWYHTYSSFFAAMRHYNAVVDKHCLDNVILKDSPRVDVFRMGQAALDNLGVDRFRS